MVDTSSNNVTRLYKKLRAQLQPGGSIMCLRPEARELLLEIKNVLWALLAERNKSGKHVVLAPGWLQVDLNKAAARSQEILNERFGPISSFTSHSDNMNDAVEAGLAIEATAQQPKDPTAWSTTSACLAALQKTLQILQDSETSNAKSMTQGTPNQQFAQGAALILQQTKAALAQLEKERDEAIKANKTTPAAKWLAEGLPDPHGDRYNCQRANLIFGDRTDDEIANAVFLCDHRASFESMPLLTAAKDRIRWLSRSLVAVETERDAALAAVARVGAEMEALRAAITRIAGDFCPDLDSDAPQALAEMREALEAALSAAPPPSPWRPFTTAPKDGTVVDLWTVKGFRIPNCQWLRGEQRDPERCGPGKIWEKCTMDGWAKEGSKNGCGIMSEEQFTHWMLPVQPVPGPNGEPPTAPSVEPGA